MLTIGVLVSGSGSNLQAIIDAIENKTLNARIAVVISNRIDAFALERAKKHNIPHEVVTRKEFPERNAFDHKVAGLLRSSGVDLVVLAGFMRLVTPALLDAFPERVINIHPSLLPSFPGLDAQTQALTHGVKITGCTVHLVDGGLDTGPIIIQAAVPVLEGDTVESLSKRILAEEHRIYPQAIRLFAMGKMKISGRSVSSGSSEATSKASLENPLVYPD